MSTQVNTKRVSFDLFDTLFHRLVLAPVDVFEMARLRAFEDPRSLLYHDLLRNFSKTRIAAEANARNLRVRLFGGEGEVNIDEIYDQWRITSGVPREIADWLKLIELDCERQILVPSIDGMAFYNEVRLSGCEIVFASDMYLSSSFLRERLVAFGFEGSGEYPLYVSGEVRLSKHRGTLYQHIAKTEQWSLDKTWLHVGDSARSDIAMATKAGLSTHFADWAHVDNTLTCRGVLGSGNFIYSLTEALAKPQAQRRLPEDPLERIGYQTCGPLIFGFTCWLLEQLRGEGIKHAAFVARDGWLMKQVFELVLSSFPDLEFCTSYLYLSRKIGLKTGVREWNPHNAWIYIGRTGTVSPRRALKAAGLDADEYAAGLQQISLTDLDAPMDEEQGYRLFQFFSSISMDILARSLEMRRKFADHYDSAVPESGTLAFVDIGWVGNMQRLFLHSLSDKAAGARVSGFYLGLHRDHLQSNKDLGMEFKGWLNGSSRYNEVNEALLTGGVELLEFLLTAPHGSTIDLRETEGRVEPVLEVQGALEQEHQEMALRAQKGIIRFVQDYRFLLSMYSPGVLANPVWADDFLRLVMQPSPLELDALSSITHSDAVGSNEARSALASKLSPLEVSDPLKRSQARELAFWKGAFDRLNP